MCPACKELMEDLELMGGFRSYPEIDGDIDEFGRMVTPPTGPPKCSVCPLPADVIPYVVGYRNGGKVRYLSMFFCSPAHAMNPALE